MFSKSSLAILFATSWTAAAQSASPTGIYGNGTGTGLANCSADCHVVWPNLGQLRWVPMAITKNITYATEVVIINTKKNTTRTSTKYNTIPEGYTLPPTNAAGTVTTDVTVLRGPGETFVTKVAYPTQFEDYEISYSWWGVLPTSNSNGPTCARLTAGLPSTETYTATITADTQICSSCPYTTTVTLTSAQTPWETITLSSHPSYPQPTPAFPSGGDAYGTLYTASWFGDGIPQESFLLSAFPSEAPKFKLCGPEAVAPATAINGVAFLTATSTRTTDRDEDESATLYPDHQNTGSNTADATPTGAYITAGGQTYTAGPSGEYVFTTAHGPGNGHPQTVTLYPGSTAKVGGTTYSLPSTGGYVIVGSETQTIAGATPTGPYITANGQTYTAGPSGEYVFTTAHGPGNGHAQTVTLAPGSTVKVGGTTYSLPSTGGYVVIGSETQTIAGVTPTGAYITANGRTYTAGPSGEYVFTTAHGPGNGHAQTVTLEPGSTVKVGGTTYSLPSTGGYVVIGTSTQSISNYEGQTTTGGTAAASTTTGSSSSSTRGIGDFINSGLGGSGKSATDTASASASTFTGAAATMGSAIRDWRIPVGIAGAAWLLH